MSPVTRSSLPSTGPRLHVWKRTACLAVAIALVAVPVSVLADHVDPVTGVLAEHVEGGDPVTGVLDAPIIAPLIAPVVDPDYVWDGKLAASYSAPVSVPAYTWDPAEQAAMVRDHFLLEHASE